MAYAARPVREAGGAVIGAFGVLSDETEIRRAMNASRRVAEYQARAAQAVTGALTRLAAGDLAIDVRLDEGDEVTREARRTFEAIGAAMARSAAAVRALVEGVNGLARAATEGRLNQRADPARHEGDYRIIVDGLNRTLDAVVAPVNDAAAALERLAARDLRARVAGAFQGDHARIKDAVNQSAEGLHRALAQVSEVVEQVAGAAAQIASSSHAVAAGASEQASSLEATTTSIASVTEMIERSAAHAQQANALAVGARASATEGASEVEQLQSAMGRIRRSAEGTGQIIKDVSEIAFQTNLLALNAAVEAARAGDAGRGFAVVAEEVRSLALRSKEAAAKTEELIRDSVKEVGAGEAAARQVAGRLGEIAQGVSKVTDVVAEIAAAAKEQASGVAQVRTAVTEMDKVTQQNAASAEESSSSASELSGQAQQLADLLATFQLAEGGRAARPRSRQLPPPTPGRRPGGDAGGWGGSAA